VEKIQLKGFEVEGVERLQRFDRRSMIGQLKVGPVNGSTVQWFDRAVVRPQVDDVATERRDRRVQWFDRRSMVGQPKVGPVNGSTVQWLDRRSMIGQLKVGPVNGSTVAVVRPQVDDRPTEGWPCQRFDRRFTVERSSTVNTKYPRSRNMGNPGAIARA